MMYKNAPPQWQRMSKKYGGSLDFAGGKGLSSSPTLESVAQIFIRDDTEDEEIDKGAKEAE